LPVAGGKQGTALTCFRNIPTKRPNLPEPPLPLFFPQPDPLAAADPELAGARVKSTERNRRGWSSGFTKHYTAARKVGTAERGDACAAGAREGRIPQKAACGSHQQTAPANKRTATRQRPAPPAWSAGLNRSGRRKVKQPLLHGYLARVRTITRSVWFGSAAGTGITTPFSDWATWSFKPWMSSWAPTTLRGNGGSASSGAFQLRTWT
jgi:hypothetical protein